MIRAEDHLNLRTRCTPQAACVAAGLRMELPEFESSGIRRGREWTIVRRE